MRNMVKNYKKYIRFFFIGMLALALILLIGLVSYFSFFKNKIYPNTFIAGINLSGLSLKEASDKLSKDVIQNQEIILTYQDQTYKINRADINLSYDFDASVAKAYNQIRTGNILTDFKNRIGLLFKPKDQDLVFILDNSKLFKIISIIAGQVSSDAVFPSVSKTNGGLVVNKGLPGKELDQGKLFGDILDKISKNNTETLLLPVNNVGYMLDDNQAEALKIRAEKFINKSATFKFEYKIFTLEDKYILKFLDPIYGYEDTQITETIQKFVKDVERDPQNPKFVFDSGKVTEFQPALDGIKVNREELRTLIIQKLDQLSQSEEARTDAEIPVVKTLPEISTDKVNDLGIKELIGRGTSTYFHSIPGRVHNVALATSRINGTLVKPGETFSFNKTLGDVSAFTGYQQAYIISEGKTILGDGGGVCQVSSTLFRAILNAGLPITERQAHAYRVSYYEQGSSPGLDATVFDPSPDLKFTNDTPGYILIEAKADTKNYSLVFELYGTSDGRVSTISKPIVSNVSSPPEDRYQDDPGLPMGTLRQIDYKAWGARVTFNYLVKRNGQEIINKTFVSNYKPWAAVYLRGTGPVQ